MIIEIIVVCLLSRMKGLHPRFLFRTWTFYPILLAQCVLVVFQASIFFRSYVFVPFVPYVEMGVILSFLFAMFAFRLYKPATVGAASIVTGTVLNKIAIAANGGKMPVYPTFSYLTGYVTPEMLAAVDGLHTAGGTETKLKLLTDYIDYGYSILSIGDVMIHLYACFMLYALIKAVSLKYGAGMNNGL